MHILVSTTMTTSGRRQVGSTRPPRSTPSRSTPPQSSIGFSIRLPDRRHGSSQHRSSQNSQGLWLQACITDYQYEALRDYLTSQSVDTFQPPRSTLPPFHAFYQSSRSTHPRTSSSSLPTNPLPSRFRLTSSPLAPFLTVFRAGGLPFRSPHPCALASSIDGRARIPPGAALARFQNTWKTRPGSC